ncbi:MAG: prolyl oligopeptidase family serine peptidase [Chitinivibrionales bacterium]|nr:prolyl oligopeptidase family serine peptidase [Chitinivibrionales bacterium]
MRARQSEMTGRHSAKSIRFVLILFSMSLPLFNCNFIINKLAFFPDSEYQFPAEALSEYLEEVFIDTRDGEKLQAYHINHAASRKIIIFFHGNAGNLDGRIGDLLKMHELGYSVLGVSYRGYGKSSGRPSERGIFRDADAALAYARNNLEYAQSDIVIFGRSLGTAAAVDVARGKDVYALVLVTPLTNGREYVAYHGMGWLKLIVRNAFNNSAKAASIQCPTLIIHGTADRTIPYFMGKQLYEVLPVRKKLVTVQNAGHDELDRYEIYWKSISEFLALRP